MNAKLLQNNEGYLSSFLPMSVVMACMSHLDLLPQIIAEIDQCVSMFNELHSKGYFVANEMYINSVLTSKVLDGKLLNIEALEQDWTKQADRKDILEETLRELAKFEFIHEMQDTRQLAVCFAVAAYRTYYLQRFPELRHAKVQVASTIEEMSAYLYQQGNETEIFRATKHWLLDWQGEGFAEKLALQLARRL